MDTHGAVKACRGCESSPHALENHPFQMSAKPVRSDLLSEANAAVTMLHYTQLLQQVQTLVVAVQGLQQSILHAAPAPPKARQPPPQPSSVASVPEDHKHDECSEPRRRASPGLAIESFYYHIPLPSTDLGGIDLARKVDDMGCHLKAFKVRSSRPLDAEFNVKPPFSPHIMSEAVPPKFRMP